MPRRAPSPCFGPLAAGTAGADVQFCADGRGFMGNLRPPIPPARQPPGVDPVGEARAPFSCPEPGVVPGAEPLESDSAGGAPGMRRFGAAGVPCLDRWKAFILACMSSGRPPALTPDKDGGAIGRRAALSVPSGVDDAVIEAAVGGSEEERRGGSRGGVEEESDGECGDGSGEVCGESDRTEAVAVGSEGRGEEVIMGVKSLCT